MRISEYVFRLNQAYYYACGRNDAYTADYVSPLEFAKSWSKEGYKMHSLQTFYNNRVVELTNEQP